MKNMEPRSPLLIFPFSDGHFSRSEPVLSVFLQTFIRHCCPPLLLSVLLPSLSPLCAPLLSPLLSNFLSQNEMLCTKEKCVHSLSPAPVWVLVGGNGLVMKRRPRLCKHTCTLNRFKGFFFVYVCKCVYTHTCTRRQVAD